MGMDDYISREAAKEVLCDYCSCEQICVRVAEQWGEDDCWAMDALKAIPAADVRPVVRGHWINGRKNVDWDKQNPDCPESSCFCSVCGDWLTASDEYPCRGNYCPNCGADLREVEHE